MKQPKHNADYYCNWWLQKFHNISVEEVIKQHPEQCKTPDWFKLYPCTQEQYKEWKDWAIKEAAKDNKATIKWVKAHFWSIEIDCAPFIQINNKKERELKNE